MSDALRCIIVDDEPMDRELLKTYAYRHDQLRVASVCSDAVEATNVLDSGVQADVLLLDIEMPELSGLDLARLIDPALQVIFVTSNEEYAVEAFDVKVADYLVKPVRYARFLKAINRVIRERETNQKPARGASPVQASSVSPDTLFVDTGGRYVRLAMPEILYVQAEGNYVQIHLEDGSSHLVRNTMKKTQEQLPSSDFVRVHRSYIVRVDQIKDIEDWSIVTGERAVIPVSESYRDPLMNALNVME
jgi:DNA-binding LytR/AlgR family response regulator